CSPNGSWSILSCLLCFLCLFVAILFSRRFRGLTPVATDLRKGIVSPVRLARRPMKAVMFDRFGDPADVLQIRDVPLPNPGRGWVRVPLLTTPTNPSALLVVRGQSACLPRLPATPGFEGVGVVETAGPGLLRLLRGLKPGRRVAVLNGQGGN